MVSQVIVSHVCHMFVELINESKKKKKIEIPTRNSGGQKRTLLTLSGAKDRFRKKIEGTLWSEFN